MLTKITSLGRVSINAVVALGRASIFLYHMLIAQTAGKDRTQLLIKQLYNVGVLSFLIVTVSGFFIGMVLGLQGYTILSHYGSEGAVGQLIALSIVRELGPVITALLFAGRAGSALTAEIGLMKASEQLSSMEIMGVDPLQWVIAPRFLACLIAVPILTTLFNATGILGGSFIGVEWLGVDQGSFWSGMLQAVDFIDDIVNGLIKSFVFAIAVSWIATFQGYDLYPTPEGISRATTKTVVYSSLTILGLDFILTAVMFG